MYESHLKTAKDDAGGPVKKPSVGVRHPLQPHLIAHLGLKQGFSHYKIITRLLFTLLLTRVGHNSYHISMPPPSLQRDRGHRHSTYAPRLCADNKAVGTTTREYLFI